MQIMVNAMVNAIGVLVFFGINLSAGLASAGCVMCGNGHVTCHDSGGHPNCGSTSPQTYLPENGTMSSIQCQIGNDVASISFEQAVVDLPLGRNPAVFRGIAFPLHNYAEVVVNPVFHFRQVIVETAYCNYAINFEIGSAGPYVLAAFLNCEGQSRNIQCELAALGSRDIHTNP